jgi:opacity protein-like surface antigen
MDVRAEHLPERKVDRDDSVAVGVRSGSYITGYEGGSTYGDFGLGLTVRYRPEEAVGLEAAISHHNETFDGGTERAQTVGQGSVMLFANPWGRVQPYVLGGLSANARSIDDGFYQDGVAAGLRTNDLLWGPHAGAGVEFAFGKKAALDLEARYVGWLNAGGDDPTAAGALQTTAGFVVHF